MKSNGHSFVLLQERIDNLEKTLSINKGIIITLSNANVNNSEASSIIQKLTLETVQLSKQVAQMSAQAINKQTNEDNYFEYTNCLINQITSLKDQVQAKEYNIQFLQNKINKFTRALRKEAVQSRDTWKLIKNLNKKSDDRKNISNVIDENDELRKKLIEANSEIVHLRNYIDSQNASNLIDTTTPHSETNECSFNHTKLIYKVRDSKINRSTLNIHRKKSISFS